MRMGFHEYSSAYAPPMLVCRLRLGAGDTEQLLGPFDALLDTGSDVSVVPSHLLEELGSHPTSYGTARSVWGTSRRVTVHIVAVEIDGIQFGAVQVLADEVGNEIIIGRTILNRLTLILDGPASMTEIRS